MVPSPRLIWLIALVGFPAGVAAGLEPALLIPMIVVLAAVVAVALVDALIRERALAGLCIETPELVRFFKDREASINIRVHNPLKRTRRLHIGIPAPPGLEASEEERDVDLPAGAELAEFSWNWMPHRRGRYRFDVCYLESTSPLGLWTVRRQEKLALEIRVYPNLRRHGDLKALRRGVEGLHALRQLGRGREFEKLREYVPGDGFDEIHWKATARRGHPITKVFQVERTQEIYVIVDASRLSARPVGDETVLERAIAASLVVGAAAERRGDLFGLAAFSHQVEAFVRARNGKAHYAACRDSIYELHPRSTSPDFDEIATFLRLRLRRRAMLLFLTSLDDPVLAESFARAMQLLASRHLVMVGMLRPPSAQPLFQDPDVNVTGDIYRQLAGHISWKRLRELESTLGRRGVRLTLLDSEKFSSGLIQLYDEVKQRQLL
ncbi:MAG TPA: DUF58 domain-containing protein [Candidatus Limnocylindrales bacterium]|nr:DUF58 domain-containing protein [Candidatus Limnocylindrales bacterium]